MSKIITAGHAAIFCSFPLVDIDWGWAGLVRCSCSTCNCGLVNCLACEFSLTDFGPLLSSSLFSFILWYSSMVGSSFSALSSFSLSSSSVFSEIWCSDMCLFWGESTFSNGFVPSPGFFCSCGCLLFLELFGVAKIGRLVERTSKCPEDREAAWDVVLTCLYQSL